MSDDYYCNIHEGKIFPKERFVNQCNCKNAHMCIDCSIRMPKEECPFCRKPIKINGFLGNKEKIKIYSFPLSEAGFIRFLEFISTIFN